MVAVNQAYIQDASLQAQRAKKNILLIHMPQWNISQPPMGIAYVGSYLRFAGYQVTCRDLSIEMFDALPEQKKYLMSDSGEQYLWIEKDKYYAQIHEHVEEFIQLWAKEIIEAKPDAIGFTALISNIFPTEEIIKLIRPALPEVKIIVGGPLVTRYDSGYDDIQNEFIDFVVTDEGEETCLDLLDNIFFRKEPFNAIEGLLYKESGQTVDTGPRKLIDDISTLPFPAYCDFNTEMYAETAIPILGSRGCIFACTFCSETVFWKRFRYRKAENIADEMEHQLQNFKTNYFYIVDSLINGNMQELERLCDIILERGLDVNWGGKASIRTQMTREILDKMYAAGCKNVEYGIESGSPKVLRDMRKGFTTPIADRVLKDTFEAGIKVGCFFLVGFPTETEEDYKQTKYFIKKHEKHINHITPGWGCGIPPGSDVYENPDKYGVTLDGLEWYSEHSTREIRDQRVQDFRAFCHSLDMEVY